MFEALGLNTESFSSNAASAGNAVINYRRYELSGEAASSSDKPNPFEGQGTLGWEELPNVLRAQIEATRVPAKKIILMSHFRKSFDVRRPTEGL